MKKTTIEEVTESLSQAGIQHTTCTYLGTRVARLDHDDRVTVLIYAIGDMHHAVALVAHPTKANVRGRTLIRLLDQALDQIEATDLFVGASYVTGHQVRA